LIFLPNDFCIFDKNINVETCIGYYASPIGIIQISTDGECITGVIFIEQAGENKKKLLNKDPVNPLIKKCIQQLDEYFNGTRKVFDLPITFAGTEFQKNVWNKLNDIPYGNTTSYLSLSKTVGNIKAIRAVGAANGKNKISIIIPCHRVIGSNGDMVGYGGEVWRKKWLLDHEAKYRFGVQKLF
jgi:methylated-DNA-[protein]-cysteine S-methyltransferase